MSTFEDSPMFPSSGLSKEANKAVKRFLLRVEGASEHFWRAEQAAQERHIVIRIYARRDAREIVSFDLGLFEFEWGRRLVNEVLDAAGIGSDV